MEPNDTPPDNSSGRTVTIQLTRDTLVLLAALLFLGAAILLAVFFPSSSPNTPTSTSVAVGATGTALSEAGRATSAAAPTAAATPGATPEAQPTAGSAPEATADQSGYPAPTEDATGAQNNLSATGVAEQPTAPNEFSEQRLTATATEIPSFLPTRLAQPTNDSTNAAQQQGYPGPAATTQVPARGATSPAQAVTQAPTDEPLFQDTPATNPTPQPPPTPPPTSPPAAAPTARPAPVATARPPKPTPIPAPTAIPLDELRGNVRWTAAQSPIVLRRDQRLVPGATLIIEPGVEVRLAPGVSFYVEGTMYAIGRADRPIRFVGSTPQRWEGLFGRPGSNMALEYTEIHGGGAGGTVLTSEGGNLVLHHAQINDNGGHIQVNDSRLEMRDSEIAGNDMPYGSALEATYSAGGFVTLTNNRIGGNRMQAGTSPLRISSLSGLDTLNLDLQSNLLVGQEGPDLTLSTNGPLQGGLSCNALIGGTNGLSVRSDLPQVPGFNLTVRDNATEMHTPPIIPEYLKYGIGRGATSELALDMRGNWWGNSLGPYEPDRHADGRGEAVGDNIEFDSWLTERPACAPHQ